MTLWRSSLTKAEKEGARMSMILPKHAMTEEDIKLQYITPALTSKWPVGKITM